MKKNTSITWFSIILALGLTLFFSFTWLFLLEYMVPYARNVKNIENSSNAFYQSYAWIEQGLYSNSLNTTATYGNQFSANGGSTLVNYNFSTTASGTTIPALWQWDSEYNVNKNRLSQNNGIQLLIWNGRLSPTSNSSLRFNVRIPNLDNNGATTETFLAPADDDIILWQLSSVNNTISTQSWALLDESQIQWGGWITNYLFMTKTWTDLNSVNTTFKNFYDANCTSWKECVLSISVVNAMLWPNKSIIPYLEYSIVSSKAIPLPEAVISSTWKSRGFGKSLEVRVPQLSTNRAFDFTIFQ